MPWVGQPAAAGRVAVREAKALAWLGLGLGLWLGLGLRLGLWLGLGLGLGPGLGLGLWLGLRQTLTCVLELLAYGGDGRLWAVREQRG